jgi:hypothetical protein
MPPSSTPAATETTPVGRYHVAHYGKGRNFALYEHNTLLAVTVYKRGAEAIQRALEARDTVIAEQAARIEQLMAAARPPGPERSIPAPTRYRDRVRHGQEEQPGLFCSKQKERFTEERRGSGRSRT